MQKNNQNQKSVTEVNIVANKEKRKAAFASFNRDVNLKNVAVIQEKIQEKGYRVGEPIQVLKAENAMERGVITLQNINGETIQPEEIKNYYLVVDGHHRTFAVSQYNDWASEHSKELIEIPAIEVKLVNSETVTEYCNEINCTKKEWSKEDYVKGAASVHPNEGLLQRYNELIKSESNPKGFCLSTLNHIFCNGYSLTKRDFTLLCTGVIHKGTATKKEIIPAHNLKVGNEFIEICKGKGIAETEISKRYLIVEFNKNRNSKNTETALKILKSITSDDISAMTNENGKLNEQKVIDHFKLMTERFQ